MEAEYDSQDFTATVLPVEKSSDLVDSCEEILLEADTSITNGAAGSEPTNVEYLEEHDPMEDDPMENFNHDDSEKAIKVIVERDENDEHEDHEEIEALDEELEEVIEEQIVEEEEEEEEAPVERKPTQVPKKRKDAAILAAAAVEELDEDSQEDVEEVVKETKVVVAKKKGRKPGPKKRIEEEPTSSARAAANKDNTVKEDQCRVCMATEDLVSLFKTVERSTVADMLMTICPTVSIARKDFMPQFICNTCLDNVAIAIQLKTQCEHTERELRKKLSRHKNKVRRPAGYVVIDAPAESDPPTEEEDDVEFKVSDAEISLSAGDDSEDSDYSIKRKRVVRGAGGRRGRRKSVAPTPTPKPKEKKRVGRPPLKRPLPPPPPISSDDESQERSPPKKKRFIITRESLPPEKPSEYPCDECEQIFPRKLSLVLHKKAHTGARSMITCEVCGKQFKMHGAYRTHLEKHKAQLMGHNCEKCNRIFTSKLELRRHMSDEHSNQGMVHICNKCKRSFVSEARLVRHQDGHCPGLKSKRHDYEGFGGGKDLFKAVAPLTTTYWSDSFSD